MTDRARPRGDAVGRVVRAGLVLIGLALVAATAFGLWHVVVGGVVNGNPRAGAFGVVLALAAGIPLLVGAWVVRHPRQRTR